MVLECSCSGLAGRKVVTLVQDSLESVASLLCLVAGLSRVCVLTIVSWPEPSRTLCDSERFTSLLGGGRVVSLSGVGGKNGSPEPEDVARDRDSGLSKGEGLGPKMDQVDKRDRKRELGRRLIDAGEGAGLFSSFGIDWSMSPFRGEAGCLSSNDDIALCACCGRFDEGFEIP